MYIPKYYLEENQQEIISLMQKNSFATIISAKENYPVATHLPFITEEINGNVILSSHMAKANTQWDDLNGSTVLIIFQGNNAYISPKYYESNLNVPTWNYLAIHAYGEVKLLNDESDGFRILEKMIAFYDQDYLKQWESLPAEYKLKMLKGIVPFEIKVNKLEAKKKLSQNKEKTEIENIIAAFEKSSNSDESGIAELMKLETDKK